jgi:transposase
MRSDMEDMPEALQTPENIIDCFLDRGGEGERIIKCLAEFGFEVVRAPPAPVERFGDDTRDGTTEEMK